jgi:CxxC motif-containing protein
VSGGRGEAARLSDLVCIACPIACRLEVTRASGGEVTVGGNRCARGETYGREEILAPRRVVTAVVPTGSPDFPCAPVRTDRPIQRHLVNALLRDLYAAVMPLPIRQGQVLLENFDGARVIFTRTLPPDDVAPVGEAGAEAEGEDEIAALEKPF